MFVVVKPTVTVPRFGMIFLANSPFQACNETPVREKCRRSLLSLKNACTRSEKGNAGEHGWNLKTRRVCKLKFRAPFQKQQGRKH